MKALKPILFLLVTVTLLLTACGGSPSTPDQPAQPEAPAQSDAPAQPETPAVDPNVPVKGGTAMIGSPQEPGTLSPLQAAGTIDDVIGAFIVEGLVGIDAEGNYVPTLAESLPTLSEDGLVLTYTLKKGIKWSNGDDFVCADVQFTLDAILSDLSGANTSGYGDIESIECADDHTAIVTMVDV